MPNLEVAKAGPLYVQGVSGAVYVKEGSVVLASNFRPNFVSDKHRSAADTFNFSSACFWNARS
jgi:hypothetical protein